MVTDKDMLHALFQLRLNPIYTAKNALFAQNKRKTLVESAVAPIATILQEEQEPQRSCERLAAEANEKGGRDNITVIVACFAEH